jgi:uncharacterized protein (DUF2267 family)
VTKQEFIDSVADRAGISEEEAAKAVEAVLATVSETLREDKSWNRVDFEDSQTGEQLFFDVKSASQPWDKAWKWWMHDATADWSALSEAAEDLRREAAELERSHEKHADRIEKSRQKLRDIVEAA